MSGALKRHFYRDCTQPDGNTNILKGNIRQAIIQLCFIYKNYTVSQKVDHSTDGDNFNLVIAAVDLQPRMDKDEVPEAKL